MAEKAVKAKSDSKEAAISVESGGIRRNTAKEKVRARASRRATTRVIIRAAVTEISGKRYGEGGYGKGKG